MEEFKRVLEEELSAVPTDDVVDAWVTFQEVLGEAQKCLPLATERGEKDWVTDEVQEVSKKKQEAWT